MIIRQKREEKSQKNLHQSYPDWRQQQQKEYQQLHQQEEINGQHQRTQTHLQTTIQQKNQVVTQSFPLKSKVWLNSHKVLNCNILYFHIYRFIPVLSAVRFLIIVILSRLLGYSLHFSNYRQALASIRLMKGMERACFWGCKLTSAQCKTCTHPIMPALT